MDEIALSLDERLRQLLDAEAAIRGVDSATLARDLIVERLREIRSCPDS